MDITEFFDINNPEHIRAWRHYEMNGFWPDNFLPIDIIFPNIWYVTIRHRLAEAWIHHIGEQA